MKNINNLLIYNIFNFFNYNINNLLNFVIFVLIFIFFYYLIDKKQFKLFYFGFRIFLKICLYFPAFPKLSK